MRILVTGGCGYIGSVLVPKLLALRHQVDIVDLQWFGDHLQAHLNLRVINLDIRNVHFISDEVDCVIHLAAVANDPCGELNPRMTWEINALGTMQLAKRAARAGVKQFIYASSGSVYGVHDGECMEDTPIVPLTDYNKSKAVSERALLSCADSMVVQIVRPGTVCGYSPRQRLDVTVNQLTMQALTKGVMKVAGADLWRANIHIADLCRVFTWLLRHPEHTGVFNAAFDNLTIGDIARLVQERVPCEIQEVPIIDRRSYRINSDKLLSEFGRENPKHSVRVAIHDLVNAYHAGNLIDSDECYNLITMKRLGI